MFLVPVICRTSDRFSSNKKERNKCIKQQKIKKLNELNSLHLILSRDLFFFPQGKAVSKKKNTTVRVVSWFTGAVFAVETSYTVHWGVVWVGVVEQYSSYHFQ